MIIALVRFVINQTVSYVNFKDSPSVFYVSDSCSQFSVPERQCQPSRLSCSRSHYSFIHDRRRMFRLFNSVVIYKRQKNRGRTYVHFFFLLIDYDTLIKADGSCRQEYVLVLCSKNCKPHPRFLRYALPCSKNGR